MTFLPKEYKVPTESKYMKFKEGENRFRVLSEEPIMGWEYWIDTKDGKRQPIREKDMTKVPAEHRGEMKHFWAFVVWNYDENRMQILEITQKTIMAAFTALSRSEAWGSPTEFDIVVTRVGTTIADTEYSTMPQPKEELEADVSGLNDITLEALYDGDDPFKENLDVDELLDEVGK